jgi:tetratricopeptide (TPR) repeat protein
MIRQEWTVGLMTGTVLDGNIDVALLRSDGETIAEFGPWTLAPYPSDLRPLLVETLAQAADWGNLGILQGLQGNHLRAIVYLHKAYQLHQQTQNHSALGQDLVHLAEVFQLTGRLKRAARCLQRAINCFSQCNSQGNAEQEACVRLHELQRLLAVQQHDPLLN